MTFLKYVVKNKMELILYKTIKTKAKISKTVATT